MSLRSLHHIALAVPDVTVGRTFYTDFGLESRENGNHVAMRCHGRDQDQVLLFQGRRRRMHHVSFGTKPELVDPLKARLEGAGTALLDPPPDFKADGLWFRDPDGLLVNVR